MLLTPQIFSLSDKSRELSAEENPVLAQLMGLCSISVIL